MIGADEATGTHGMASFGAMTCAIVVLGLVTFHLYSTHVSFPSHFHADEYKKLHFALTGNDDFHHPILMIQLMRAAGTLTGATTRESMRNLGRRLSAIYTVAAVVLCFAFYRYFMGPGWAFAAALAVGVSPILVVHAHYVKEDSIFLATAMATLWALPGFMKNPGSRPRTVVLGIAMGFALAAQYKAVILIVIAWCLPLAVPIRDTTQFRKSLCLATMLALCAFALICYPLFGKIGVFGTGLTDQIGHALSGHKIKIYAIPETFTFHLRRSLAGGLTLPLLGVCLAGLLAQLRGWGRTNPQLRMVVLYTAAFYLTAELSPSKPGPDFMRYMVPIAPTMVLLGFCTLQRHYNRGGTMMRLLTVLVSTIVIAWAGTDSVRIVMHLEADTRFRAAAEVRRVEIREGANVFKEHYATANGIGHHIARVPAPKRLLQDGYTHALISNFAADRYIDAAHRSYQRDSVYRLAATYQQLWEMDCTEILPAHRSIGFSNPTIRLIRLESDEAKLP